ncbi:MAG: pyridoxine 5'-phosphate synthase [Candidatus Gastranaerophilales bacterium]|nr:pyridoxine 5'-phosphate synthase [Candidatus Gastranaerophilales bacterium]
MLLGVNIDHVATLRNARGGDEPSVIQAAKICIEAGANGITTHLREDRRHITDYDVFAIKNDLNCKLNLEMAATYEMKKIALELLPHSCCIVPENRQEVTTEGGLDVAAQTEKLKEFIAPLIDAGIQVSLFIDPEPGQVSAASKTGAQFIELHTGAYSLAFKRKSEKNEFSKLKQSCSLAHMLDIKVNAGHGLNYENVSKIHEIDGIYELNIGHSIISKAVFIGLDNAVKEMLNLVNKI